MDTDRLLYFTTIAETGSLTKASEILGISHSGLSKAISSLESETNLKIFQPHGRGLEITQDGKWLYQKAQEILKISDEIKRGQKAIQTNLRIGLSGVIAMTCAHLFAQEFQASLSLIETDVGEVEGKILNSELDFGIGFIPIPKPELEYLELGKIKFNSYAREDLVKGNNSEEIPFAVPTSDFPSNPLGYRSRDGWPADVERNPKYFVSSFSIALNLLREGTSAVYMPDFVAHMESKGGQRLTKIKNHAAAESVRKVYLIKNRASVESKEMKKAAKIIRQICHT